MRDNLDNHYEPGYINFISEMKQLKDKSLFNNDWFNSKQFGIKWLMTCFKSYNFHKDEDEIETQFDDWVNVRQEISILQWWVSKILNQISL